MPIPITDIIGPVMVGPSSSHTAGAARIGRIARHILNEPVADAVLLLYGSFASTYKGHGTDRALVAGLLDMRVDDVRLRDSFSYAAEAGMTFRFGEAQLKQAHPNTVVLHLTGASGRTMDMQASSVGGGNIEVNELNRIPVSFTGRANTLIVPHHDQPGRIAAITACMADYALNIASMQVFRKQIGGLAVMIIETDGTPTPRVLNQMRSVPGIQNVIFVEKEQ